MVVPPAVAKPPSWDTQINSSGRFKVLGDFGNAAVLDRETGVVWEQSPDTNTRSWFDALNHCYQRTVGGRKGWRLPTIEELASLIDPNNPGGNPDLPPGHPFSNVQSSGYWSATTYAAVTNNAWLVDFPDGAVLIAGKAATPFVWCVRGGQGIDGVQ
jgi:hypothetical protein